MDKAGRRRWLFGALTMAVTIGLGICVSASRPAQGASLWRSQVGVTVAALDQENVFNYREVPDNQQVPVERAQFDRGGYQLFDTVGEIIVVPFSNHNLYVMKFGLSSNGATYFVNHDGVPVLYMPRGAYLTNAVDNGARWYPFGHRFHPHTAVYISIAPSWNDYDEMGWYPNEACYGGYYCDRPVYEGGIALAIAGFVFIIGDTYCDGWWGYDHYWHHHHPWYHTEYWNRDVYQWGGRPDYGHRTFNHQAFARYGAHVGGTRAPQFRAFGGNHGSQARSFGGGHNASFGAVTGNHGGHQFSAGGNHGGHQFRGTATAIHNERLANQHGGHTFTGAHGGAKAFHGTSHTATSHAFRGTSHTASHAFRGTSHVTSHAFRGTAHATSHAFRGTTSTSHAFQGTTHRSFSSGGSTPHRSFNGGGHSFQGARTSFSRPSGGGGGSHFGGGGNHFGGGGGGPSHFGGGGGASHFGGGGGNHGGGGGGGNHGGGGGGNHGGGGGGGGNHGGGGGGGGNHGGGGGSNHGGGDNKHH